MPDETSTRFMSCTYFRLELAQAGDVIPGSCLAEIKAGTRRNAREALRGVEGKGASHTRHKQCQCATWNGEPDPQEGSSAGERTWDNTRGLLGPPASCLRVGMGHDSMPHSSVKVLLFFPPFFSPFCQWWPGEAPR